MLDDRFFIAYGIRDMLNLNYEEHKSLKGETKMWGVDYNDVLEKLSWAPKSKIFMKKVVCQQ